MLNATRSPFFVLFILLPLLMLVFAAWVAGATTLRCQRTEPRQVDCTVTTVHWLGLGAAQTTPLPRVQSAQVHSYACEKTETKDGKETRVASTCEELVIISDAGETKPSFSPSTAGEINHFLRGEQHEWSKQEDTWLFALAFTAFAGLWMGVGWLFNRANTAAKLQPLKKQITKSRNK